MLCAMATSSAQAYLPGVVAPFPDRSRLAAVDGGLDGRIRGMAGSVFGIANDVTRELVYKDRVGELRAQPDRGRGPHRQRTRVDRPAGTFR